MALGDVKAINSSVITGSTLDIKPPSGEEWVIHNIYWSQGTIEIYKTDGTNTIKFATYNIVGGVMGTVFHVTNSNWIQIKNTANTSTIIGYDGIQTK